MATDRPGAVFNIGSQQGNISNVAGDMTVYGGQHYRAVDRAAFAAEVAALRSALAATSLDPALRVSADRCLHDAERELGRAQPEPDKVARPVERLTRLLKDAGALAGAVEPLSGIASLLGVAGKAILALIL